MAGGAGGAGGAGCSGRCRRPGAGRRCRGLGDGLGDPRPGDDRHRDPVHGLADLLGGLVQGLADFLGRLGQGLADLGPGLFHRPMRLVAGLGHGPAGLGDGVVTVVIIPVVALDGPRRLGMDAGRSLGGPAPGPAMVGRRPGVPT